MAVFTWVPDQGLTGRSKPRLRKATFGDGYEQTTPDGINYMEKEYTLNFSLINQATYAAILAFLDAQAGAAFDWTPPNGTAARWVCESWDDKADGVTYGVTATFRRVYGK